jgi:hypothetical protein
VKSYYASIDHLMLLGPVGARRLGELVRTDDLDFEFVPCACPPGMERTQGCNYGRRCGRMKSNRRSLLGYPSRVIARQSCLRSSLRRVQRAHLPPPAGSACRALRQPVGMLSILPLDSDFQPAERLTDSHCGASDRMRRGSRTAQPSAMQDGRLAAVGKAALCPPAPVGSQFRRSPQPDDTGTGR